MKAVKEETCILNSLIEMGEEKRQLIISNRLRELETLIHREGIIISRLERAEGARFKLQEKLAAAWELPVDNINVSELQARVAREMPTLRLEMETLFNELKRAVSRLQQINRANCELTNYALEYVDYLWTVVEGDVVGLYSADGIEAEDKPSLSKNKLFDLKV